VTSTTPYDHLLPGVPRVESPFFEQIFKEGAFDTETLRVARELHAHGFAVVEFPDPDFDDLAASIIHDLHDHYDWDHWREVDFAAGMGMRVQDAWRHHAAVRRIATNEHLLRLLGDLYGRRAWPFQTLNFPVGTQQHFHTDSIHFSSVPEKFMCGVWVALEDINEDAGPLVYYPGTHRWPIYTNEHIGRCVTTMPGRPTQGLYEALWRGLVAEMGIQPSSFRARKGQALIWAANLLHGGSRQRSSDLTRWSQVTHYFFEDCAYYTPMLSDPMFGTVAFRELQDLRTGAVVPNRYCGETIPSGFIEATRVRALALPEGWDPALYLLANPDVAAANHDPADHYLHHGKAEGRALRPGD
jgi:hypothetical protein